MTSRLIAGLALVAAAIAGVLVLTSGDDRYLVKIEMDNAGGLRNGANVRVGGAPSGQVSAVRINDADNAVAELRLDPSVAPIGKGARALVDTDGLFGERFVQIDRGDVSEPLPSGTLIGTDRTGVSVRLDDVVDALDLDTRQMLGVFINEQGAAIVGRGRDLAEVLAALPPGLDATGRLLDQFAADNQALGRLVEVSDRVVGEVAREREHLGRLVGGFGETLDVLDSRRENLGETVRRAPATLQAARRALVALDDAAGPLVPAARGLRATAPALTETLEELPAFTESAVPTLRVAADVAPELERLGTRGAPAVRELRPLARVLASYTRRGLDPFTTLLDQVAPDLFGLMEGWARSTQGRDAASQIFRFGASSGSDAMAALFAPPPKRKARAKRPKLPAPLRQLLAPARPDKPKLELPKPPELPKLPKLPAGDDAREKLEELLDKDPGASVGEALGRLRAPARTQDELLDFLLGP